MSESLSQVYKELAAQLGDIEFRLTLLLEQKQTLLAQINVLNQKAAQIESKAKTENKEAL